MIHKIYSRMWVAYWTAVWWFVATFMPRTNKRWEE